MIYSKTCEYAIRALIPFADHADGGPMSVSSVVKESGVPKAYVAKIFQCLVGSRILTSRRGPAGGYVMVVPASKLTLLRVVQALDDLSRSPFSNCIMGLDKCNDTNPCPLHPIWARAKEKMIERLAVTTIADVLLLGDRFRSGRQRRFLLSKRMRNIFSL